MTEGVERTDLGERLGDLAVDETEGDARAEVGQRAEGAAILAGRDDRLDRALADVRDRKQAEPDGWPLDRELDIGAVDVRREDLDGHPPALGDGRGNLLLVRAECRED